MAGHKRSHHEMETFVESSSPGQDQTSGVLQVFEYFKNELDEHHDRRERVIKASRDITAFSKKIIFALQRAKDIGQPLKDKRALADTEKLKQQVRDTFDGVRGDLQGINAYRYQRQISGGIQEWMEAVLFEHYLVNQSLMTHDEAAKTLPSGIMLTHDDYLLGLFDMTGELMKIAITYMATNGKLPGRTGGASVLTDLQIMQNQMELLNAGFPLSKELDKKLDTTRKSVEKVEKSVYSMIVRGKERPKGWKPEFEQGERQYEEIEAH